MAVDIQHILQALCSNVALVNTNETHVIYALDTPKEAQLAHDVLSVHGFDVRIYHDAGSSRLYIERKMLETASDLHGESVLQHMEMLNEILESVSQLSSEDYKISFVNTPSMGKQISIYFPPIKQATAAVGAPSPAPQNTRSQTTVSAESAAHLGDGRKSYKRKRNKLYAGPQLAKSSLFNEKTADSVGEIGVVRHVSNFFIGNLSQSFYAMFIMLFFLLVFLSLIIVTRGYICPDVAHAARNVSWYCAIGQGSGQ